MTVEFRTKNPQIIVSNNPILERIIIHDVQLRITNEDYEQFMRIYFALDVRTKTEALWFIIHKGMNALERDMIKNRKLSPVEADKYEEEVEVS